MTSFSSEQIQQMTPKEILKEYSQTNPQAKGPAMEEVIRHIQKTLRENNNRTPIFMLNRHDSDVFGGRQLYADGFYLRCDDGVLILECFKNGKQNGPERVWSLNRTTKEWMLMNENAYYVDGTKYEFKPTGLEPLSHKVVASFTKSDDIIAVIRQNYHGKVIEADPEEILMQKGKDALQDALYIYNRIPEDAPTDLMAEERRKGHHNANGYSYEWQDGKLIGVAYYKDGVLCPPHAPKAEKKQVKKSAVHRKPHKSPRLG